jgi:hypothetical protein
MLLYAVTIFLSAFLLFQVQPLIAKIILPWFGGTAAVWSAAMLFFQLVLLAGYAYAHLMIRYVSAKRQMIVHVSLLVASCVLLPIFPAEHWKPSEAGDPTLRILALLAATIGLPYALLSATSPLLQAWYVRRTGSKVPYRLFALSNFGSMLALVSFPFLVEPNLSSHQQANTWSLRVYRVRFGVWLGGVFESRGTDDRRRRGIAEIGRCPARRRSEAHFRAIAAVGRAGCVRVRAAGIDHHTPESERRADSVAVGAPAGALSAHLHPGV